jgi:chromosome segregation ATPase
MKTYLCIALALACAGLVAALIMTKRSDSAQHETDSDALTALSNRLDTAQSQIAAGKETALNLSKTLDETRSASLALSNQLTEARSAVASDMEQITDLNRQIVASSLVSKTLTDRLADLTNQMTSQVASQVADLKGQLASTQTNLDQLNKGCLLLEDRFRRDVAARVVAERKFNNLAELQAQMKYLAKNPAKTITAEGILAGLDIVVKSNVFYIYSPN